MSEKEYLDEIRRMIIVLSKEDCNKELKVLKEFVEFRMGHSTPQLDSLRDIFYFLCGILFDKGLSDYWNGREVNVKNQSEFERLKNNIRVLQTRVDTLNEEKAGLRK